MLSNKIKENHQKKEKTSRKIIMRISIYFPFTPNLFVFHKGKSLKLEFSFVMPYKFAFPWKRRLAVFSLLLLPYRVLFLIEQVSNFLLIHPPEWRKKKSLRIFVEIWDINVVRILLSSRVLCSRQQSIKINGNF